MSGNGKQVQSAPGQSQRYGCARPPTPQRNEGFHGAGPQGGSQGGYAAPSAPPPQPAMRGPPPQQSQQQPPQEMKANHSYRQAQAQAQAQAQQTYQYRGQQQQGTPPRQPSHHRQPPMYGTTPGAVYGPSMSAVIYTPHMSIAPPSFTQQQTPRQPYYPPTGTIPSILPQQYYSTYGSQQQPQFFLTSGGAQAPTGMAMAGGVGRAAAAGQNQNMQQSAQQQPSHAIASNRYPQTAPSHQGSGQEKKRRPNAIAIVDPKSGRDVTQELLEGQGSEGADGERATPRPDEGGQAVVEEFARLVADRANEKDSSERSDSEAPSSVGADAEFRSARPSPAADSRDTPSADSERLEEKPVERTVKIEASDTPVVSAISDSPEIVLKQCPVVVKSKQETHSAPGQIRTEERKTPGKMSKQAERPPVEISSAVPDRAVSEPRRESIEPEPVCLSPSVEVIPEPQVVSPPTMEIPIASQCVLPSSIETVNGDRDTQREESVETIVEPPVSVVIVQDQEPPKTSDKKIADLETTKVVQKDVVVQEPVAELTPPESSHKTKQGSKKQQKVKNVPAPPPARSPSPVPVPIPVPVPVSVKEEIPKKKSHSPVSSDALFLPAFEQKNKNRTAAKAADIISDTAPVEIKPTEAAQAIDAMKNLKINDDTVSVVESLSTPEPVTGLPKVNDLDKSENKELDVDNYQISNNKEDTPNAKDSDEGAAVDENGQEKGEGEMDASGPLSLKYNYSDDQWSPINTAGKKCYESSFLMQLRDDPKSKLKPDNIVSDNAFRQVRSLATDPSRAAGVMRQNDLLPGFARGSSGPHGVTPNRKSQHGKPNSKGGGTPGPGSGGRPNVIHVNLSLRSDVKLNETENAWKPTRMRSTSLAEEEASTQDLYQTFRSILNKLTPEKFDTLMRKVKELNIDTEERLSGVIGLIFEKAIDEPNFSKAYALMCKELEQTKVLKESADNKKREPVHVSFRILIVSRCQNEFEKEDNTTRRRQGEVDACTDPEKKKEMILHMEEEERSARRRSVGNIRFIGELFKQGIIVSSVIVNCIKRLLLKTEEETLECLCKLLMTIGKDLENNNKISLQPYFDSMKNIVDGKVVSSRVRFMLQDVIDLRYNSWVPRQQVVNPMTMDRIKQMEIENESGKTSNFFSQNYSSPSGGARKDDRPGNMAKRGGSKSVTEDGGWSTAPARNSRSKPPAYVVDSGKLSKLGTITPITQTSLQPSIASWGSGSNTNKKPGDTWNSTPKSGGPLSGNRKPVTTTQVSNMYNVLDTFAPDGGSTGNVPESTAPKKAGFQSKGASIERSTFKSDTIDQPKFKKLDKDNIISKVNSISIDAGAFGMFEKMKSSFSPDEMPVVIEEMVANGLECNDLRSMQLIGEAFGLIVDDQVVTNDIFLNSFKQAMNASTNFFKMKGNIWKMLSGFLWAYIGRVSAVTFTQIHSVMAKVIELKKGYDFLSRFFLDKITEKDTLQILWEDSNMDLSDWMDADMAEQLLDEFSLKFLTEKKGKKMPSPEAACEEMLKLMRSNSSVDAVKEWIQRNIGEEVKEPWFVRALTEAICTYTLCSGDHKPRFDEEAQERYLRYNKILIVYVDGKHELQCLYAIQRLLNKLEHPQGIVCGLFEYIWETGEVISNEGFLQWEASNDPHELEGKGVMLKLLTSFFNLLQSDDSSEDTASIIEGEY